MGARTQTGQTLLEFARDRGSQRCADFLQRSRDKASRLSANARIQKKRAQYKHGDGERADDFLRQRIKGVDTEEDRPASPPLIGIELALANLDSKKMLVTRRAARYGHHRTAARTYCATHRKCVTVRMDRLQGIAQQPSIERAARSGPRLAARAPACAGARRSRLSLGAVDTGRPRRPVHAEV